MRNLKDAGMEQTPKRPKLKEPCEAMRGWAESLAAEIADWPGVTLQKAFGMTLVYRSGVVFAALPGSRALYADDAILLKFAKHTPALAKRIAAEPRFKGTMEQRRTTAAKRASEGQKWLIFKMSADADVHAAIEWMAEGYRVAGR
jgi:hypothetical protein